MEKIIIDPEAITRFSGYIKIASVTGDLEKIKKIHRYFKTNYPLVHQHLKVEVVNGYSLVFTWLGSNPESHKKPVIFLSHMDVVRADEEGWEFPAFSGQVFEGDVEGRGTQDTKCSGTGLLESAEHLLASGYWPEWTIIFAFGHDEETGGKEGAAKIVEHLEAQGVKPLMVLDEGGFVGDGFVPNVEELIAFIGCCEKGKMVVKLSVQADGGHAGMPKQVDATSILMEALTKLEKNPMKPNISGPVSDFLDDIRSKLPLVKRIAIYFKRLFKKIIIGSYLKTETGNATMRTTISRTFLNAGSYNELNSIPQNAEAILDCRLIPGQKVQEVFDHITESIGDERVKIELIEDWEADEVSPVDNEAYQCLTETIKEFFGVSTVARVVTTSITDARWYKKICPNVFRFWPLVYTKEDLTRIHADNENITVEAYENMIRFYIIFVKKLAKMKKNK